METIDPMVDALKILCKQEKGHEFVADKAKVSAANLDQIIKGVKLPSGRPRGIGPGLRAKLTAAYPNWLGVKKIIPPETSNVTPGPNIRGSVPLLSSVQAGAFKEVLDRYSGEDGMMDQIPTTVPVNRYTFALRVQGDSMEPKFTEGMLLIVEPEMDAQHNDYVIVKNGSEETTFKRLVRDGEDWFLKPLNDRYPIKPLGKNTIVGVVRGVTEQFR